MVSDSRRPSRLYAAGESGDRLSCGLPACAVCAAIAGARADRSARERLERRPVIRHRHGGWRRRRNRDGEMRAHALARGRVAVLDRSAALAEPPAEHVRARVHDGRARGGGKGGSGGVPAATSPRSAAARRRAGGREGGELATAPSPMPELDRPERRICSGRGIACVLYEGDNGYCAMVAEVDVHLDTGAVDVTRLVMALDSGPISNPDGLRNQAEGGALHGMSRALFEEVTWDDEKVTSVDWRTYRRSPSGSRFQSSRPCSSTRWRRKRVEQGRRRSPSQPRRSETRSSTPQACAFGRCLLHLNDSANHFEPTDVGV